MSKIKIVTNDYTQDPVLNFAEYMGNKAVKPGSDVMTRQPEEMGNRHSPLAHVEFANEILNTLESRKMKCVQTAHSVNKGGLYFGITEISGKARHYVPVIAWRASHNQRISATIYTGVGLRVRNVVVLTNEHSVALRQTHSFKERLPVLLSDTLDIADTMARDITHTLSDFHKTRLTDLEAEHALANMVRNDILASSQFGHALTHWDTPSDPDMRRARNVWRLFHAVALGYKPKSGTDAVSTLINRSPRLMAFCRDLVLEKYEQ